MGCLLRQIVEAAALWSRGIAEKKDEMINLTSNIVKLHSVSVHVTFCVSHFKCQYVWPPTQDEEAYYSEILFFIDLKGGIISGSYFSADFDSEIGDSSRIWNLILVYCILLGLILCNLRDPTCDKDQHVNVVAGDTIGH